MERRRQDRFAQIVPWLKTETKGAYQVHLEHPTMIQTMSTVLKKTIMNMAQSRRSRSRTKSRSAALLRRTESEDDHDITRLQNALGWN